MNCEQHSHAIAEAAFALPGEEMRVMPELTAHLAECAACREELELQRALAAAIDRGVAAKVSGAPLPGFAARVRARLAEGSQQHAATWRVRIPAFAWGLAALALLTWLVWSVQGPRRAGVPEIAKDVPAAPALPKASAEQEGPLSLQPPEHRAGADRGGNQAQRSPHAPATPKTETPLPEVLLAGDEWGQVVKLYELSKRGSAGGLGPVDTTPLEEKVEPLLIARLEPIKPLGETASTPQPR